MDADRLTADRILKRYRIKPAPVQTNAPSDFAARAIRAACHPRPDRLVRAGGCRPCPSVSHAKPIRTARPAAFLVRHLSATGEGTAVKRFPELSRPRTATRAREGLMQRGFGDLPEHDGTGGQTASRPHRRVPGSCAGVSPAQHSRVAPPRGSVLSYAPTRRSLQELLCSPTGACPPCTCQVARAAGLRRYDRKALPN